MSYATVTAKKRRVIISIIALFGSMVSGPWSYPLSAAWAATDVPLRPIPAPQAIQDWAHGIAEKLEATRRTLRQWSIDPDLVRHFEVPAAPALKEVEADRVKRVPQALRIRLIRTDNMRVDLESDPPLTYTALYLMEQAVKNRGAIPAEVVLPTDPKQHIVLIERVGDGAGKLLGFIHLSLTTRLLEAQGQGSTAPEGYIEVQQANPGVNVTTLARYGEATFKTGEPAARVHIPDTLWVIAYWPPMSAAERAIASWKGPDREWRWIGVSAWVVTGAGVLTGLVLLQRKRLSIGVVAAATPNGATTRAAEVVVNDQPGSDGLSDRAPEAKPAPADDPSTPLHDVAGSPVETSPAGPGTLARTMVSGSLFREDGVVGVVGATLTGEVARELGHAFGSVAHDSGRQEVVVGRDARASGGVLAEEVIRGIRASGCDVIDIGMVPAPVLRFAAHYLATEAGVMVTGGAEPDPYNGLQFVLHEHWSAAETLRVLHARLSSGSYRVGAGALQCPEIGFAYVQAVTENIALAFPRGLTVVVDGGNAIAGPVACAVLRALGHKVIEIFCEVDSTLPYRAVDLSQAGDLGGLIATVRQSQADLGLVFDGEGCRCAVVDRAGALVTTERLLMLWIDGALSLTPGRSIVCPGVWASSLQPCVERWGGTLIALHEGESLEMAMSEADALLGADHDGRVAFRDRWYGFADGLYAAARLLEVLVTCGRQDLAELLREIESRVSGVA